MWHDHKDSRAVYVDLRRERHVVDKGTPGTLGRRDIVIAPDVVADFTNLPFTDETFCHVVFDPPHHTSKRMGSGPSHIAARYGRLFGGWEVTLAEGFKECFRVLKRGGTLIFKWGSVEIPLKQVLALTDVKPLYGHRSGRAAKTHWVAFIKPLHVE